jgi:hypothetical protein
MIVILVFTLVPSSKLKRTLSLIPATAPLLNCLAEMFMMFLSGIEDKGGKGDEAKNDAIELLPAVFQSIKRDKKLSGLVSLKISNPILYLMTWGFPGSGQ